VNPVGTPFASRPAKLVRDAGLLGAALGVLDSEEM